MSSSKPPVPERPEWLDQFPALLLVVIVTVALLSLVPIGDPDTVGGGLARFLVYLLTGLMLILAISVSGVSSRAIRLVRIFVALVVLGALISAIAGWDSGPAPPLLWIVLVMVVPVIVLRRVLAHEDVKLETILGVITVFLLIAVAFAFAFLALDETIAAPFFGHDEPTTSFMYFSLTNLSTVGWGDLAAVPEFGRLLATSEAIIAQVFLVVIVARLVAMYRGGRMTESLRARRSGRRDIAPPTREH